MYYTKRAALLKNAPAAHEAVVNAIAKERFENENPRTVQSGDDSAGGPSPSPLTKKLGMLLHIDFKIER